MRNSPSPFAVEVYCCPVCKLRSVSCAPGTGLLPPVAVVERTTPSTAAVLDACCRGMRIAGPCSREGVACPEGPGWGSCADATPAGPAAGTATKKITAQAVRSATDTVRGKDIALLSCSAFVLLKVGLRPRERHLHNSKRRQGAIVFRMWSGPFVTGALLRWT